MNPTNSTIVSWFAIMSRLLNWMLATRRFSGESSMRVSSITISASLSSGSIPLRELFRGDIKFFTSWARLESARVKAIGEVRRRERPRRMW